MIRRYALLMTILLLLTGCGGAAPSPAAPSNPASGSPAPVTMDDQLAEVGRRVPGFGGFYLEQHSQSLVIYLTDPTRRDAALQALEAVFGKALTQGRTVVVKTGDYSIEHLSGWYASLQATTLGAIWTDMDEGRNRIVLGVTTREAKARLEAEMARLSIPPQAVIFETPGRLMSEANPLEGCLVEARPPGPDPTGLKLSKNEVKPGEQITLKLMVDGQVTRGGYADLECWNGSEWMPIFTLHHRDGVASAVRYSPIRADVGYDGPGPEPVLIPEQLAQGWYRIRKDAYLQPGGSKDFFGLIRVR